MKPQEQQAVIEYTSPQVGARKMGSRVALIMALVVVLAFAMQFVVSILFQTSGLITSDALGMILVSFVSMYVIALPVGAVLLMRREKIADGYEQFGIGKMICFIMMGEGLAYIGNLAGTVLTILISGGSATNPVMKIATGEGYTLVKIVCLVLIAPFLEEWVFRKLVIDNVRQFDEKNAVIISALLFGLYHVNLYQLFYTVLIGLLWAYVYLRTGKIRYSYIMHVFLNFKGVIIAGAVLSKAQLEVLAGGQSPDELMGLFELNPEILRGIVVFFLFSFINLTFAIIGIVLLIRNRKRWEFAEATERGGRGNSDLLFNTGMVIFIVVCAAIMGLQLFIS